MLWAEFEWRNTVRDFRGCFPRSAAGKRPRQYRLFAQQAA